MPLSEPATFGVRTPEDMLRKLEREYERFTSAKGESEKIDHGMNFAMTAWHLCEWITPASERKNKSQLHAFRDRLTMECPDLLSCQFIAESTKHLECGRGDPRFKTEIAPGEINWVNNAREPIIWVNNRGQQIKWTTNSSDLWIIGDDTRQRAAYIFSRVLTWWRSFIRDRAAEHACNEIGIAAQAKI